MDTHTHTHTHKPLVYIEGCRKEIQITTLKSFFLIFLGYEHTLCLKLKLNACFNTRLSKNVHIPLAIPLELETDSVRVPYNETFGTGYQVLLDNVAGF